MESGLLCHTAQFVERLVILQMEGLDQGLNGGHHRGTEMSTGQAESRLGHLSHGSLLDTDQVRGDCLVSQTLLQIKSPCGHVSNDQRDKSIE